MQDGPDVPQPVSRAVLMDYLNDTPDILADFGPNADVEAALAGLAECGAIRIEGDEIRRVSLLEPGA